MRRQVLSGRAQPQAHARAPPEGRPPEADLQVIRRGKALEYYSRHYGKVLVDDGRSMTVLEALVGINQLLDEETGGIKDPPPVNAEPFTRQFLRLFDGVKEIPRDQIQKFLRGTGIAPLTSRRAAGAPRTRRSTTSRRRSRSRARGRASTVAA
jgi:putative DNA methylase